MARAGRRDRGLAPFRLKSGQVVYYVRLYHEGRRRQFGSFPTKTEARQFYNKAKDLQRQRKFFPESYQRGHGLTFADALAARMQHNTNTSVVNDTRYAAFWTRRLGSVRLRHLTPSLFEQAQRELARDKEPQTVLHYMKFARHVLNREVRDGHLEKNPINGVKLPTIPKGRLRFLSYAEWGKLKKTLGAEADMVRYAIITGLRQHEQFSRQWTDVDLKAARIILPTTKAGKAQYLTLSQEAVGILTRWKRRARSRWIHPSENPDTHLDPKNFYHRVYLPAVQAAKLEDVNWHTLRHTGASWLAMSGASDRELAAYLRHGSTALVGRYAHLSPSYQQGIMERVSAFRTAKTATYTATRRITTQGSKRLKR